MMVTVTDYIKQCVYVWRPIDSLTRRLAWKLSLFPVLKQRTFLVMYRT